jgi:very-short-patch-repair endonuclease
MRTIYNLKTKELPRQTLRNQATPQEVILWSYLRNSKLGFKFRRQHSIGNFIVDFYCPETRLIVEIDGSQHIEQEQYDNERTIFFSKLGCNVIRFWNNEINTNIEGVIMKIEEELKNITTQSHTTLSHNITHNLAITPPLPHKASASPPHLRKGRKNRWASSAIC